MRYGCQLSVATGSVLGRYFRGPRTLELTCVIGGTPIEFLCDPTGALRIHVDPRPHGRRERDLLDVAALRSGRLRADDLLDQRGVVLDQLALVEALLADRDVDVR